MTRPITDTLRLLQSGAFIDKCSEQLAELVLAVEDSGKAGKLTITLDIKRESGAMSILADVRTKVPQAKKDADLLWPTVEGNLVAENPKQQKLALEEVRQTRTLAAS